MKNMKKNKSKSQIFLSPSSRLDTALDIVITRQMPCSLILTPFADVIYMEQINGKIELLNTT